MSLFLSYLSFNASAERADPAFKLFLNPSAAGPSDLLSVKSRSKGRQEGSGCRLLVPCLAHLENDHNYHLVFLLSCCLFLVDFVGVHGKFY